MTYTLNYMFGVALQYTGSALCVQLYGSDGNVTGSRIYSTFSERGGGYYLWNYGSFPDSFRGGGDVYVSGGSSSIVSFAINPEEAEYTGLVEGTYTLPQWLRLVGAALFGKVTGGGTSNPKFRDTADTKDRIDATVDVQGNRTSVTLDGS